MTPPQVQDWTQGLRCSGYGRRSVIEGRTSRLKPISADGIRGDVSLLIILVAAVVFLAFLAVDFSALDRVNSSISRLSRQIESVESSNTYLQEGFVVSPIIPNPGQYVSISSLPAIRITVPSWISR